MEMPPKFLWQQCAAAPNFFVVQALLLKLAVRPNLMLMRFVASLQVPNDMTFECMFYQHDQCFFKIMTR